MRNDTDFGPEFHRLSFREALQAPESERRLVDYEIIVVTVEDDIAPQQILSKTNTSKNKLISNTSMYQRMAAVGLALYGITRTTKNEQPTRPIHSCIGYCNTLQSVREVTRVMSDEQLHLWASERQAAWNSDQVAPMEKLTSGYIDGKTRAPQRFEELSRLGRAHESAGTHLTMNAKVLTEGVDVPALDAVCFMEPRDSEIDIVQAVGRVMRKPKNGFKDKGYIVIPVVMDRQQLLFEDADATLSKWNQDWRVLGQVLRALKSHDPSIETDLEKRINVETGFQPKSPSDSEPTTTNFWEMLRNGVFNQLIPTIQSKVKNETEAVIQTSLIKQAILVGARSMQKETGLARRLANVVGVADSTNQPEKRACLQASLMLTNSLLMHQRLIELSAPESKNISDLLDVHRSKYPDKLLLNSWYQILQHDYQAIFKPSVDILESSKVGDDDVPEGMRSALRTLSEHCRSIAKKYAELGMDQAGELFQSAMDEADAQGAYYTLSPSAMLLAELACDARAPETDPLWSDPDTWKRESILDPACGSGTLLTAIATAIRRRGSLCPTAERNLVEMGLTGMDRNAHALQVSGAQIAIQSPSPSLRQLGLYAMRWGRDHSEDIINSSNVRLGSLELLISDRRGLDNSNVLVHVHDHHISQQVVLDESAEEKALHERLSRAVIGITNPPYTKGAKVDKNISADVRKAIQERRKSMLAEKIPMRRNDIGTMLETDTLRPAFSVLLEEILDKEKGVIAKVMPTTACTATDSSERLFWAKHFDILYIITLHCIKDLNWSVDTGITESLMIGKRRVKDESAPETQFINLNQRPKDTDEVMSLRNAIVNKRLDSSWGNVTSCPVHRMRAGDWTAAVWYDSDLARASWELADHVEAGMLDRLGQLGRIFTTKQTVGQEKWNWVDNLNDSEVSVARNSGQDGFRKLQGQADAWARRSSSYKENMRELVTLQNKSGHLLITNTQDSMTGRLIAFCSKERLVGYTWTPAQGVDYDEAKALTVWMNSTLGRISMRSAISRKLTWPMWQPGALMNIAVPKIRGKKNLSCKAVLCGGFEEMKTKELDLYRDGYTSVRKAIDEIVAEATGIPMKSLTIWGKKLAEEPTIQGRSSTVLNG